MLRTTMCNLAQVLLVGIILLVFGSLGAVFFPTETITGLINYLGQLPFCNTIADILSQFTDAMRADDIAGVTVWTFFREFPAAIISGICIHFCTSIFNRMWAPLRRKDESFKPLPIFPGFLGLFLSSIVIISVRALAKSDLLVFGIEIGIILLMVFGIKVMITGRWGSNPFSLKRILLFIIEGLYAVVLSANVAGLIVIMKEEQPVATPAFVAMLLIITVIASFLVSIARIGVDRDEK